MVAASALIALTHSTGVDYANIACQLHAPYCGDAAPELEALAHGRFGDFFEHQLLLGPTSLAFRAPFVLVARAIGGHAALHYELGTFACLVALGLSGLLVASEMRSRGRPPWQQALVAAGVLVNPVTFRVVYFGHPEEALGAGLCVAAAVWAIRRHAARSGIAAGLAVATKLWALLALPALAVALGRAWSRAAVSAILVVAVLYLPMAVGNPGRFGDAVSSVNDLGRVAGTAGPGNVWWFAMERADFRQPYAVADGRLLVRTESGWRLSAGLARLARSLAVVLAFGLALLWSRRPRAAGDPDVLLLLALVLLLRCLLDPNNLSYYHLPFLASLVAWEGIARGFPLFAIVSGACLEAIIVISPHVHSDAGFTWLYLGWALPTVAVLTALTFGRPSRLAPCPSSA